MQTLGRIIWLAPDRFDVKPDKSTWLEMSRCLRELGWTVTILTGNKSGGDTTDDFGGLVEWVPATDLPFVFRISLLRGMRGWLTRNANSADVVVMNEDALWLVPHLKRLGVRFVHLDFRTLPVDEHRWKKKLDRLLSWWLAVKLFGRDVDGYSFITERLRQEVETEFALDADDYAIWHSGVNLDRFTVDPSDARRSEGVFRLFYHGSISRKRGLGAVIEAIAMGGLPPDFEFLIVGDGPDRAELEQLAAALGIKSKVRFRGLIPYESVAAEIAAADVCICPLPDRLEWNVSSPLKVFEYMACAKPMVLTPIPAHLDALAGSQFVVWTQGFEPQHFHNAIVEAFAHQVGLRAAAAAAPSVVRGRHEWCVQAAALHRYLSGHRGGHPPPAAGRMLRGTRAEADA